jgi:hypothetical protein
MPDKTASPKVPVNVVFCVGSSTVMSRFPVSVVVPLNTMGPTPKMLRFVLSREIALANVRVIDAELLSVAVSTERMPTLLPVKATSPVPNAVLLATSTMP